MSEKEPTLTHLLDQVAAALDHPPVSVETVMRELGERSFAPVILVIALLMVSPLSGIPGSPTMSAILILIVGVQALIGRSHLWLPGVLLRRHVPETGLARALGWLRRPAEWFDRHSHKRWPVLTIPPMRWITTATCVAVTLIWPFLELMPFVTSIGAAAVSLLSFGLITRDGLYVLIGYALIFGLAGMALRVLSGI